MGNTITYIPIADLVPSEFHAHLEYQYDNLENLENSIKQLGILEPLIVRKKEDKYEIIIGNRRYNAAKNIGMDKIPVIIENITDEQAINMIITNNVQRKDLTGKEEASLYEKAISYPNMNAEKLSINLGIPIDRIYSKLKIIKKHNNNNQIINNSTEENEVEKNIINNDIINLSDLDKNEIRRERLEMNENQFMANEMNNGVDQANQQMGATEPAFGGRFFPSMDEQNGNLNEQIPTPGMNNNLNMQPEPATEPATIPNFQESIPTPEVNIPTFNNAEPVSTNPIGLNEVPQMATPISEPTPNLDVPSTPDIAPNNMEMPNEVPAINPEINMDSPVPNEIPPANPSFDMNNIPNLNAEVKEKKDITPIINIIKSISTNMEALGYKMFVAENEDEVSYKINIEVEK